MFLVPLSLNIDTNASTNTTLKKSDIEFITPTLNRLVHNENNYFDIPTIPSVLLDGSLSSQSTRIKLQRNEILNKITSLSDNSSLFDEPEIHVELPNIKTVRIKAKIRKVIDFEPAISID